MCLRVLNEKHKKTKSTRVEHDTSPREANPFRFTRQGDHHMASPSPPHRHSYVRSHRQSVLSIFSYSLKQIFTLLLMIPQENGEKYETQSNEP